MRAGKEWLGSLEGPTGTFMAGSFATYKIVYHVGRYGIDDGGRIRIAKRSVSDSMSPQFSDPRAPGYTTVWTNRDVKLEADNIPIVNKAQQEAGFTSIVGSIRAGHIRPFSSALQIDVRDGSLYEGDRIEITFGNKTHGSPGIKLQTFREEEHIFKVFVDPFGTGLYREVEGSPRISIIGGPAKEIQIVAPSQVLIDKPFDVIVRALDYYGNRSDVYSGKIFLKSSDPRSELSGEYVFTEEDQGAKRIHGLKLSGIGQKLITVDDSNGLHAVSNPINVMDKIPELKLYWGDMHGQTKETVGTGSLDEYFSYMRDVAALDFGAWQGNDFQVTMELWDNVKKAVKKYYDPGNFVTFLGYEWSGLTSGGGDHNIYFLGEDEQIYRSDHWLIDDKADAWTDRYPISKLWETFHERDDVLAIPHVGGRHGNFDYYDPERIPLIEVHSHHGTFEWFLEEAMKRRLKVGFIAASDDHTCRPGLSYPTRGFATLGGYMGIYAKELTREALWEALWAKRAYATTGKRIILCTSSEGHFMGEEFMTNKLPELHVEITGTTHLSEVEIKRWDQTVYRHPFAKPAVDSDKLFKLEWSGARVKSRPKTVNWDGGLKVSNGRILDYQEFAFDYPKQGIEKISDTELNWKSTTGGDPDGVIFKLEFNDETEVVFTSNPVSFNFKPSDITYEPKVIDAGGLNQKVKISTIKKDLPVNLEFTYKDMKPENGLNAYWVRVVQADGAMAWSSPIFINYQ